MLRVSATDRRTDTTPRLYILDNIYGLFLSYKIVKFLQFFTCVQKIMSYSSKNLNSYRTKIIYFFIFQKNDFSVIIAIILPKKIYIYIYEKILFH